MGKAVVAFICSMVIGIGLETLVCLTLFGRDLEVKIENRTDVFDMKYKRC